MRDDEGQFICQFEADTHSTLCGIYADVHNSDDSFNNKGLSFGSSTMCGKLHPGGRWITADGGARSTTSCKPYLPNPLPRSGSMGRATQCTCTSATTASLQACLRAGGDALLVEINVTDIATGVAVQTRTVDWTPTLTAEVDHLLDLQLDKIGTRHQVVMTRFISTATGLAVPSSDTVHLLQPPAKMFWMLASRADLHVSVGAVLPAAGPAGGGAAPPPAAAAAASAVAVTFTNTNGAVPMFYVLATSTLAGRFARNLLYLPAANGSATVDFYFAAGVAASSEEVLASLSVDWLNKV